MGLFPFLVSRALGGEMKKLLFLLMLLSFNCHSQEYIEDERAYDKSASRALNIELKDKWDRLEPKNYYYILSSQGYLNHFPLVIVYVFDGKVVKVKNLHPFMNTQIKPKLEDFYTINEMFSLVVENKKNVKLVYNSLFGYPELVEFETEGQNHSDKQFRIIDFSFIRKKPTVETKGVTH